uniref:E3 ubiquitin-protein ligase MARCHF5 n=1 Tax=Timema monikensis TaxID=170555 RepID=A0A7R9E9Z1_9NEOP|nr:unnamed protein product [Timema monikensis]
MADDDADGASFRSDVSSPVVPSSDEDDKRYCWVCFATDEDDETAAWVQPCNCRGTTKWVHQACIQRWVDEKQKGNTGGKVSCPQCNTEYIIFSPHMGPVVVVLDAVDNIIYSMCPFVAAGVVIGSIYWTAVTYGAVTIMQNISLLHPHHISRTSHSCILITSPEHLTLASSSHLQNISLLHPHHISRTSHSCILITSPEHLTLASSSHVCGHKEGMSVMEGADPLVLLIGLPTIPIALVLGKMLRWEESVLGFLRRHCHKVPVLRHVLPAAAEDRSNEDVPPLSDPLSATRILCSALLTPTIATIFGRMLFDNVHSNLQKTLLGGVAFIAIKGVLKLYHKQQHFVNHSRRRILDHNAANVNTVQGLVDGVNPPSQ